MSNLVSNNPSIQKAVTLCGSKTISRLEEFYLLSSKLENEYKQDALVFIEGVLRIQSGAETKRDLTLLLLDIGFKKSNVSKMIEATRFTLQLEREKSDASAWVKSLPVSTQYVLSTCEDKTFNKVWVDESKWGEKPITQKQVEALKSKHTAPKVSAETLPPKREKVSMETPNASSANAAESNSSMQPTNSNLLKARDLVKDYPELVTAIDRVIHETNEDA
jgi:hypothetical protein